MKKTIGAAKFKEQCLAILDELSADGVVITKHGKPVARLVPYVRDGIDLIGCLRGRMEIRGNLETTGSQWNAVAEP